MSPETDPMTHRQPHRGQRCPGIAGVETASDVGRGDQRHQFGVVWAALAEIAVQVNGVH